MVTVYVLKSKSSGVLYVGMTKDLDRRISEHNSGKSKFTKGHLPWILVYSELATDFRTGRIREKYLKSGVGKEWLKSIIDKQ